MVSVWLEKRKRKLKSGTVYYWYLRWYSIDGKYQAESIGRVDKMSKHQAKKLKRRREHELEENPQTRNGAKKYTLSEYVEEYFKFRTNLRPKTISLHRQATKYILEYFGEKKRLGNITRTDVRSFQAAMAKNKIHPKEQRTTRMGAATVNIYMRVGRVIFSMAKEDGIIKENPFSGIIWPVDDKKKWHQVTPDEYNRMVENAPQRFKLLISLCRLAALRKNEALHLEWSDIDWEKNRLFITPKDDWQSKTKSSYRQIPICPELREILLEAFEKAELGEERIITTNRSNNLDRDFKLLRKKAKVVQYKKPLHTLRKSCINDWAGKYPMHVVQRWAGHTKIATTGEYYSQVTEDDYEKAAQAPFFQKVSTQNSTQHRPTGAIK